MNKFKVGDKAIVNDIPVDTKGDGRFTFTRYMRDFVGKEVTITDIQQGYYSATHFSDLAHLYNEDWLSPITAEPSVYKDGNINLDNLKEVLKDQGGCLCIFMDGSMSIKEYFKDISIVQIGFNLEKLNGMYADIISAKNKANAEQAKRDSIEIEIKKMEDAIAELRKQMIQ